MIEGYRVTDAHIHVQPWHLLSEGARATMAAPRSDLAAIERMQRDPAALIEAMDDWGIDRAALINYVAPDTMGFDESVNEWVAEHCRHDPERLIAVGSVHPRRHADADAVQAEVTSLAKSGIRMLKLHPAHQLVWPDAYRDDSRGAHGHPPDDKPYGARLRALYEAANAHELPILVHTGTSVFPGAFNPPCDPLLMDTVATDFPDLRLVLAHCGRPLWGEAAAFVARRHPNVWLDVSGIPPTRLLHFFPQFPRLAHKCLWGTDWPGPGLPADSVRTNVLEFLAADLQIDDATKAAVLDTNSRQLLP